MAYNENLANRIAEKLTTLSIKFEEKKMFGGVAFMIKDKMCMGVLKDEVMLRVLHDKYEPLLDLPHVKPMEFTGRVMKGFLFIEPEGYQRDAQLMKWLQLGIEFGEKGVLKTKKKK